MKRFILAILCGFSLWAHGATFPNRFTTNADGTLINGGTITNILRSYITPFDCGAVGDGVTDDAAALKRWLFIGCSSNWICFLPPAPGGSYACSTTLLITNGMNYVNIQGAGGAMFNSDGPTLSKACINFTTAVDGIRITNVQSNVRIEGIRLTNSAAYSAATHGLWLDGDTPDNDLSSWRNIGVQRFGTNMMVSSGADMLIENCTPAVGGDGLVIGPGTYSASAVLNQIHVRNCQLSYNTNAQVHVFAGQDILIENCDLSPQPWTTGTGALYVDGHGVVTVAYMHGEPYNGKPLIVATDRGNGAGSVTIRLVGFTSSGDGSPGPTSYTLVATNANVSIKDCAFGDAADGSFVVLFNGDSVLPAWNSDMPVKARIVTGGGNIVTNYLPQFRAFNGGSVAANVPEGAIRLEFKDYNSGEGAYLYSHLWYGARLYDTHGNLGVQPINFFQYAEDTAAQGGGISSTNGFITGTGTSRTPILTNFTSYAAGTAYTLTATPAQLDFGTTDPSITIANGGTYKIIGRAGIKYSSATYAGAQTIVLKLRRTNNTAADLSNSSRTVELPVLTTFTGGDVMETQEVIYTATTGDIVQLFGSVSATPSAGSVQADSAEIIAIKLY